MAKPTALPGARFELAVADTVSLTALVFLGMATAAATAYVKFHVGITGHSIVFIVTPTVLGIAAFPRRFAGSTIAGSALLSALALRYGGGASIGPAAMTSFMATGMIVDFVVSRRWSGIHLYAALLVGGLLANVVAFGAHVIETAMIPVHAGGKPWLLQIASYGACGAAAGALGAALAFQMRPKSRR